MICTKTKSQTSLLRIPSKILGSCFADSVIHEHDFVKNQLVTDDQRAYRKGRLAEYMLPHLLKKWKILIKLMISPVHSRAAKFPDGIAQTTLLDESRRNQTRVRFEVVWYVHLQ